MSDAKLLRGTLVLTAATYISKMLGLIYVIPFTAIVGQTGNALYQFGFIPYTVLLSLATLGVPLAVSKFVSKYQSMGDYQIGYRLLKTGILFMAVNGVIAFLVLYVSAPLIASWIVIDPNELKGNSMEDVIFTIRMVSVALLIVPIMAIIRGFFQGHQSMGPTAVSQVIEQIVRIIFILLAVYFIIYVKDGSLGLAVGIATLGAFFGAGAGMIVLLWYWIKRKSLILNEVKSSTVTHTLSLKEMYKEVIGYAIPLSFIGLAIPLFQLVDLFTVTNALSKSGLMAEGEPVTFFAIFSSTAHKLILIPMALATAFSITLVPTITKSFILNDRKALQQQITKTFRIILFFTVPAIVGLSTLSYPVFSFFYWPNEVEMGGMVLRYYAPIALFFSLFAVSGAILQGINKQRFAVIALVCGLIVKLSLNYILLYQWGPLGGIFSTYLGYALSIAIMLWAIRRYAGYQFNELFKETTSVFVFSTIMGLYAWIVMIYTQHHFPIVNWTSAAIVLSSSVLVGFSIYILLGYRFGVIQSVLGNRSRQQSFNSKQNED
ncbi:putative polysaccharide biosynthesis protein [Halalkalibacter akibai]|uniref:Membrane protein n=1 Tax=Halalkalibacter akibai (strain ATCC 43226 / DSM 21942 / CIP 109018 / JCM 9157 / 1139) TaxID=1236973 RepID=W4QUZ5_HALA3|nr:polysaccharide biosynthesis protein [Halalkalibacter akibai]GAE35159.1 membrane protein [Halalkalibacter akibai JCM 9157]